MASYLQIENISKSYGTKVLFQNIGFNINEGDKIALIAPNGTGKTSLLRILSGKDVSDSGGRIIFLKDIRIAFLEQEYIFDPGATVMEQVMSGQSSFEYELRAKQILTGLGITSLQARMDSLSGGEVKRVAIAAMLSSDADFYIMDEPTNHLDIDAIEYLESWFSKARCTLLMVTHDRYFLDRVCNTVMELDHGSVYIYRGGYLNYLEKRQERIDNYNAETDKVRNVLRRELEWMRSTPQARSGKAKYRKEAFYALKERSEQVYRTGKVDMGILRQKGSYLGNKVVNFSDVSFFWRGKCYLDHFSYNFQRNEKVGIVGPNASGKTTFLNLLAAPLPDDPESYMTGEIQWGESLRTGYYRQAGMSFKEDQTVLDTVSDTSLLSRFMFPREMYSSRISTLSGGEKRRLYLLTILMQEPNLLILDEPTNDLDIVTLGVLEEYLQEFKGTLVIVSHDRHFLDRLADHLFVFTGDGTVKDFVGDYSQYREYIKSVEDQKKARKKEEKPVREHPPVPAQDKPRKLTWKEQRELESLEAEIDALNAEKAQIEERLSGGSLSGSQLMQDTLRHQEIAGLLDIKETRWLELSE